MKLKEAREKFVRSFDSRRARKQRKKMRKNKQFYMGEQWSMEDKRKLKNDGRVPIVINHTQRQTNAVCGLQMQNRTDFQVYPIDEYADDKVADVMNKIVKNIQDVNDFEFVEKEVFWDGMVKDRGYYCVKPNFEKDLQGEVEIKRWKPERVFVDHNSEKYDLSDASYLGYWEWMTPAQLKAEHPKAKKVDFPTRDDLEHYDDNIDDDDVVHTGKDYHDPSEETDHLSIFFSSEETKLRKVHFFHRVYVKKLFIMDHMEGIVEPAEGGIKKKVLERQIMELNAQGAELSVIERTLPETRYMAFVYDQELVKDDVYKWSIPGTYPLIPFFAFFNDGDTLSFIDPLKDPQMESNKRRVQGLHAMNSSGFVYTEGAVVNENELREFGQRPDIHIKLRSDAIVGKDFQKYEPTSIRDIVAYEGMSKQDITELGVNPDILGLQDGNTESGVMIELRQKAGLVGLEGFFDNFRKTKKLMLRQVIFLIQNLWTAQKAIRLIGPNKEFVQLNQPQPMQNEQGGVMIDPMTQTAIMTVLNNVTVGRYDVKVSESPSTITRKHKVFGEAIELGKLIAQSGAIMPVKSMVQLSDFPNKNEVIQEIAEGEQNRQRIEELKFSAQAKPKEGGGA